MKIISKNISTKDGAGKIKLRAEDSEDMWHAYNLIVAGDLVRTVTMRKVVKEGVTGSTASKKIKINLTLDVQKVDFDPQECTMRISGQNREESKHVKIGQYHTLELALHRNFEVTKDCWDTIFLERLDMATDIKQQADLAAVVMQQGQSGLAYVCLVTNHMTVVRAKIEQSIPRKRAGRSGHKKGVERFYEAILQALLRHVHFDAADSNSKHSGNGSSSNKKGGHYDGDTKKSSGGKVKCLVIASPGYTRTEFHSWLMTQCGKRDLKAISDHRSKIVLAHSSSGHKHALMEVLSSEPMQARISDTKAMGEVKCLQDFFKILGEDTDRAYYSYAHCARASEMMAIKTLMVTDSLFRSCNLQERKKFVALVEEVRDNGGTVHIFSAQHASGQQLSQVSGVAAILRYPVPEIEEEIEMVSSESDEEASDYSSEGEWDGGSGYKGPVEESSGTGHSVQKIGEGVEDVTLKFT